MLKGLLTISEVRDAAGRIIPLQKAVDYGWITNPQKAPAGWGIGRDEVCIGRNLIVDGGRMCIAYLLGGLPNKKISQFAVGTGTTAANVSDTTLQNPVTLSTGTIYKPIIGVVFPAPFTLLVQMVLSATEANGYLLTEMGLFNDENTLIARKTRTGVNKVSDASITWSWRVRC